MIGVYFGVKTHPGSGGCVSVSGSGSEYLSVSGSGCCVTRYRLRVLPSHGNVNVPWDNDCCRSLEGGSFISKNVRRSGGAIVPVELAAAPGHISVDTIRHLEYILRHTVASSPLHVTHRWILF